MVRRGRGIAVAAGLVATLLGLLWAMVDSLPGGRLASPRWVILSSGPTDQQGSCVGLSRLEWKFEEHDGSVSAWPEPLRRGPRQDALPFPITSGEGRHGERLVERLADGWLVGFNHGEFGGGLWWFSDNGRNSEHIRPEDAGLSFTAENVVGLVRVGGQQFVLTGLDHLGMRIGRLSRLDRTDGRWRLVTVFDVNGTPRPWVIRDGRLYFMTADALWVFDGCLERLHAVDLGGRYPGAMLWAPHGSLYIGMRFYVLRLTPGADGWHETWLIPAVCQRLEAQDFDCVCRGR